jgi:hypothetical protein
MPRVRSPKGNGVSFVVLEGALRCCFASRDLWTWKEVGWATRSTWDKVKSVTQPEFFSTNRTAQRHDELFEGYVAEVMAAVGADERFFELTNMDRFMEEGLPRGAL